MSIITDITPKKSRPDDKTIPHGSITGLTLHHPGKQWRLLCLTGTEHLKLQYNRTDIYSHRRQQRDR
ncbi:hypothetical protein [Enterobacter ludwigii]|uniref:hypothetical protein n=1 Tax=Enterobacter ludwigii TaxID=299767 RepID=UPI003975AC49